MVQPDVWEIDVQTVSPIGQWAGWSSFTVGKLCVICSNDIEFKRLKGLNDALNILYVFHELIHSTITDYVRKTKFSVIRDKELVQVIQYK